jgi:hypothetical protein
VGIYSMDENQFLPYMEGVDPLIVGLPISETWDLYTSRSWVFMYSEGGLASTCPACMFFAHLDSTVYLRFGTWGTYVPETWPQHS